MNERHLSEDEWASLLAGEGAAGAQAHLERCARCSQEVARWQAALATLGQWQPDAQSRQRVRQAALARAYRRRWWPILLPAAAAAVLVLALVVHLDRKGTQELAEVDVVLQQIDATLASDPLAAVADSQVVGLVIPEEPSGERSET